MLPASARTGTARASRQRRSSITTPPRPLDRSALHNRIDAIRPDAPELARFGPLAVGVRTLTLLHRDQVDVANARAGAPIPRYDRALVVEVWYPAAPTASSAAGTAYESVMHGGVTVTLHGRAERDAPPLAAGGPFPLVILSHGYPGNRYLLGHFGENLASKGYVVASIDHADSTYADRGPFASTLVNRPLDQLFVLDQMARLARDAGSSLHELVDAERTGVIGYSMGAYGALNAVGGGLSARASAFDLAPPEGILRSREAGAAAYRASLDARVRAVVAIAPWGMNAGLWDSDGLAGIRTPVMFMAGSLDDVSGYETGVRSLFEATRNAERYLLTFLHANHNAAGPIPAPREMDDLPESFEHHADAVWDTLRTNNVAQHFATAFLGLHLRGDGALQPYLDLVEEATDGVVRRDAAGLPIAGHTAWRGFAPRTAVGLRLRHAPPASSAARR